DRSNGRIYKIVYNNQKTTKVDLQKLDDLDLARLVPSKNEWMSRHARRILQERFDKEASLRNPGNKVAAAEARTDARKNFGPVESALANTLRSKSEPTPARLRALWALHTTAGLQWDLALL